MSASETSAAAGGVSSSTATTTGGGIKLTAAGATTPLAATTTISGTPIAALNAVTSGTAATTAAIRAGQVRVVVPTNLMSAPSMIKQIESVSGRTQITAMPASSLAARTVSNASITVTRPLTQTYLPRASVTATPMGGVAASAGQRLVTPLRATPAAAVTSLTAGGSFVRSATTNAAINRNTASPSATTVISPATSTTWMAANTAGQVQLIRAIPHAPRQRIITTQGLTSAPASASGNVVATSVATSGLVSGHIVATATSVGGSGTTTTQIQTSSGQPTLQTVVASTASAHSGQQPQPTYVATLATVLPPRQHQATLVYSSNASGAAGNTAGAGVATTVVPALAQQQQQTAQSFNPTLAAGQRFAAATSLAVAANVVTAAGGAAGTRQIRQIPLSKPISTTKLSTASISIRAPNLPQLPPTIATVTATGSGAVGGLATGTSGAATVTGGLTTATARSNTVTGVGAGNTASVLPAGNLSTTRIIQLQQPGGSATQQLIGSTGRLAGNVMLQPFIVNTAGGKIGLRPPVSMAAKGQPSLTITHMGISKLPTTSVSQAQTVTAGLQGLNATVATNLSTAPASSVTPTSVGCGSTGVAGASVGAAGSTAVSLATTAGLLTTQNNITSAAGGATVVPLAITTRGGTITSIKSANGITVGKVMTTATSAAATAAANSPTSVGSMESNASSGGGSTPSSSTSVFLQQQRPGSGSPAHTTTTSSSTPTAASVVASTAAYLPAGNAIYYESVPASSTAAGVISITTTSLTSSTLTSAASSAANLSISAATSSTAAGLPFIASGSSTTFTVVPSSSSSGVVSSAQPRTIGQLQLPIASAGGAQIQAVRFSTPLSTASTTAVPVSVTDTAGNSQQQALHMSGSSVATSVSQHMVIPLQTSIKVTATGVPGAAVVSNFLRKRDNIVGSIDNSNATTVRAAKNLAPTLLSMGSSPAAASSPTSVSSSSGSAIVTTVTATPTTPSSTLASSSSPAPSTGSNFSTVSSSGYNNANANAAQSTATTTSNVATATTVGLSSTTTAVLTVEALAKKDRAAGITCATARAGSPASSEGSTTVSAHSSPGVERQIAQNENGGGANAAATAATGGNNSTQQQHHSENVSSTHFNPIHELYPNHHQQHQNAAAAGTLENNATLHHGATSTTGSTLLVTAAMPQRLNGALNADSGAPPHKRARRTTTDSQQSTQSQPSSSHSLSANAGSGPPAGTGIDYSAAGSTIGDSIQRNLLTSCSLQPDDINSSNSNHSSTNPHKIHGNAGNNPPLVGNKENSKPVEYFLRRPRNCTMLSSFKANWKAANNHFQRHTDVKQREERRPTVIDVANQVDVQGKLGGWKIYYLRAQMEELEENESSTFEKLTEMLKQMETHDKTPDVDKICDLLKGNLQRNKIIVDGISEAKNQIMKIFEHQTPVSEILSRCASKRNFKKRDKV